MGGMVSVSELSSKRRKVEEMCIRDRSRMKGLYMLWNMVDGREKTELYQVYEAVMKAVSYTHLRASNPTPNSNPYFG